jgi:hypothetical protein
MIVFVIVPRCLRLALSVMNFEDPLLIGPGYLGRFPCCLFLVSCYRWLSNALT